MIRTVKSGNGRRRRRRVIFLYVRTGSYRKTQAVSQFLLESRRRENNGNSGEIGKKENEEKNKERKKERKRERVTREKRM
jgi:hypothetical protein